jgi:hypothetical protein
MRAAVMRGSPTPSEIIMKVGVYSVGPAAQTEDNPAPGNMLADKTHGPFHRYNVSYAINPTDITFIRASDGKIHADFEIAIFVFRPDGLLVNRINSDLRIASSLEDLRKSVAQGIQYNQEISAPAKGEYFLRIVVHDRLRDRFGAVEVATSEVRNLPLPTAPSSGANQSKSPAAAPASPSVPATTPTAGSASPPAVTQ